MSPADGSAGAVHGLDEVMRNLNRQIEQIKGDVLAGLLEAGLFIQRAAQERVPVDTGNLKASAYTRNHPSERDAVEVGFTAAYAPFVHEAEGKLKGQPRRGGSGKGTYWETGEPKFLQKAVEDNLYKIVEIIRKRAEIKP
jgi:hypothetical protein